MKFYNPSRVDFSKSTNDVIKVGAFVISKQVVNGEDSYSDIPFSSLLRPSQTSPILINEEINITQSDALKDINTNNKVEQQALKKSTSKNCPLYQTRRNSFSVTSANDDFILVDLVM